MQKTFKSEYQRELQSCQGTLCSTLNAIFSVCNRCSVPLLKFKRFLVIVLKIDLNWL